MVVITVIGLMSAIVVANLDGLTDRSSLNATARQMGNQLLALRDQAALQGRELFLEVDVDKQRWRVVDVPSPTDVPDPEERERATFEGTWQTPPDGVVLDTLEFARTDVNRRGVVVVSFDAEGQLSPAGFVAYFRHVSLPDDDGVSLEVTGLTGAVDYARGRRRSEEVREADDF
jgi:type II secretory pathway pseudopilin PulG